ncbi:hypothetical protein C8R48DRAFT_678812 [Suillus tomentosus]|nr:hypothetical protein C8R48DRAFT_678812 [Suillus tomentosus]
MAGIWKEVTITAVQKSKERLYSLEFKTIKEQPVLADRTNLFIILDKSDWQDMRFNNEEGDDEEDGLWSEDDPALDVIEEDNQESTSMDFENLEDMILTDSKGLGFSSCAAPLTRDDVWRKSKEVRRTSGRAQKVWKDILDECKQLLDECGKVLEELPEITMGFRPDTKMCNGYSGLVLSRSKQRKGCKDKVRSRIGPEDRRKVPEELLETRRNGRLDERRIRGVEEWRSKGSEEQRSRGAELRPREFLPRPEMDIN